MTKEEARKIGKERRKSLSFADKERLDEQVYHHLRDFFFRPSAFSAHFIFSYVSYGRETDTRRFIRDLLGQKDGLKNECADRPQVAVPKVLDSFGRMAFYLISSFDDLEPGAMGILEPKDGLLAAPAAGKETAVILPGLAFTKTGKRAGYGGGYYDRFLQANPDCLKIGLCYEFQILDDFETEPYDIRADLLITETVVYKTKGHNPI